MKKKTIIKNLSPDQLTEALGEYVYRRSNLSGLYTISLNIAARPINDPKHQFEFATVRVELIPSQKSP